MYITEEIIKNYFTTIKYSDGKWRKKLANEKFIDVDIVKLVKWFNDEFGHKRTFIKDLAEILNGVLLYDNNKRYFPDIYIKSTNTIIEVKSTWAYKLNRDQNIAKRQACIDKGFNFKIYIYDNKQVIIKDTF